VEMTVSRFLRILVARGDLVNLWARWQKLVENLVRSSRALLVAGDRLVLVEVCWSSWTAHGIPGPYFD
jgi:hypothetical protein